jgi:hypothetical protein
MNIFITPSKLCEHFVLNKFMFGKGLVGVKNNAHLFQYHFCFTYQFWFWCLILILNFHDLVC